MPEKTRRSLRYGAIALGGIALIGAAVLVNLPLRLPKASTAALPGPQPPLPAPAPQPMSTATAPRVSPAAFAGQGRLAFVWNDLLYVLDGANGQVRQLTTSGKAHHPAWSADGQWLAFLRISDPQAEAGSLWLVRADGTQAHEVQGLPAALSSHAFVWSPKTSELAVAHEGLWLAPTAGAPRQLDRNVGTSSVAWSPDGTALAYNVTLPYQEPETRSDALMTIAAGGGQPRQVAVADQAGIWVHSWTPDARNILYWLDPLHSGSIAADGMALVRQPVAAGEGKPLSGGLAHPDWQQWSTRGELAVVQGGGRSVWTGKSLSVCDPAAGACKELPPPAGSVAVDPAWSPDGEQLAFVAATDLGGNVGGLQPEQLRAWVASHRLWVMNRDGSGAHALDAAGTGVYLPRYARDGQHILYVRDNALWLIRTDGSAPQRVVGPFPGEPDMFGFYGALSVGDTFAWYRP